MTKKQEDALNDVIRILRAMQVENERARDNIGEDFRLASVRLDLQNEKADVAVQAIMNGFFY